MSKEIVMISGSEYIVSKYFAGILLVLPAPASSPGRPPFDWDSAVFGEGMGVEREGNILAQKTFLKMPRVVENLL